MELQLLNFSIVVLGRTHNPSLLNPDFLAMRGIVPASWGWDLEAATPVITTPQFSTVRFRNGVAINVEPERLQVIDARAHANPAQSEIPTIAGAYVRTLPHVRYTAVGINFHATAAVDDPAAFVKKRFLRSGPWDAADHQVSTLGLRLVYDLDDARLVLSVDVGEGAASSGDAAKQALLVGANFHRPCETYPSEDEVSRHLAHAKADWERYTILAGRLLSD